MRSQEILDLKLKIKSALSNIASIEKNGGDVSLLSIKLAQYNAELSDLLSDDGKVITKETIQPRGWFSE